MWRVSWASFCFYEVSTILKSIQYLVFSMSNAQFKSCDYFYLVVPPSPNLQNRCLALWWHFDANFDFLFQKLKRSFFQPAVVSILQYGCTTWTLTKLMEKKLDGNYTRMPRAILNKSWWQHPTKQQMYGHLPSITKTIKVRRTRHAGHCWRSGDELKSDVYLWTPSHGQARVGRPARTYIE